MKRPGQKQIEQRIENALFGGDDPIAIPMRKGIFQGIDRVALRVIADGGTDAELKSAIRRYVETIQKDGES